MKVYPKGTKMKATPTGVKITMVGGAVEMIECKTRRKDVGADRYRYAEVFDPQVAGVIVEGYSTHSEIECIPFSDACDYHVEQGRNNAHYEQMWGD